jgi:hypothetical protein
MCLDFGYRRKSWQDARWVLEPRKLFAIVKPLNSIGHFMEGEAAA